MSWSSSTATGWSTSSSPTAGLYGSHRARERLRELIFGGVTDEDILAELEKGLGGFIDSVIVDPDPVRDDINKVSFLDSLLPIEEIRAEFEGAWHVIHATVPMFGPNSGELSIPGIHKATADRAPHRARRHRG